MLLETTVSIKEGPGMRIPFGLSPKTPEQRKQLIKRVLGPPKGVNQSEMIQIREKLENDSKLSTALCWNFFVGFGHFFVAVASCDNSCCRIASDQRP
jgi:hypothetical protein